MKPSRTPRAFQIAGIAFVLYMFLMMASLPGTTNSAAMTPVKWAVICLAIFCAVDGYYYPRRFLRPQAGSRSSSGSSPVRRWIMGQIFRIGFAVAVSLYGYVLHLLGGPEWLAVLFMAAGLAQLFMWRPGPVPAGIAPRPRP